VEEDEEEVNYSETDEELGVDEGEDGKGEHAADVPRWAAVACWWNLFSNTDRQPLPSCKTGAMTGACQSMCIAKEMAVGFQGSLSLVERQLKNADRHGGMSACPNQHRSQEQLNDGGEVDIVLLSPALEAPHTLRDQKIWCPDLTLCRGLRIRITWQNMAISQDKSSRSSSAIKQLSGSIFRHSASLPSGCQTAAREAHRLPLPHPLPSLLLNSVTIFRYDCVAHTGDGCPARLCSHSGQVVGSSWRRGERLQGSQARKDLLEEVAGHRRGREQGRAAI
jgi:hypothetical protein